MFKRVSPVLYLLPVFFFSTIDLLAQQPSKQMKDTFFLSKKRGLLGKLGKSISIDAPGPDPVKTANPYLIHTGKSVRHIAILSLGFERSIYDTSVIKNTIGVIIANGFHKNTREKIITNNLFFREGTRINPYIIADNERHLREQVYIQDARILLVAVPGSTELVDAIVITKDVFSLGGSVNIHGVDRAKIGIKEENFNGSGSKIAVSTYYERNRQPNFGYGAEVIRRNIKGSFINWSTGFQTYKSAFNSGRGEESFYYMQLEKPLVSQYIPWIGAADISFSRTRNAYLKDSLYNSDYKYSYYNADAWFGYNFGSKKLRSANVVASSRLRKFVAIRGLHLRFNDLPQRNIQTYSYSYADVSGVLVSFTAFKQDFYRTNFIYGFGRNEDVPEGFTASVIGGWTDKYNRVRPYYGVEGKHSRFNKKGFYSSYTFRFGSYSYQKNWEDIDLVIGLDHFTKLRTMGSKWLNRNFYGASFTRQINPVLNAPLFIRSEFGLPYYHNGDINARFRGTIKGETVFYNLNKFWGFRVAGFLFGDMCMITPADKSFNQSEMYSAWGAGLRTRNENLIFGTIELRGYVFPRPISVMKGYKIEISSSIRFKYNSIFIRKPDFVTPN